MAALDGPERPQPPLALRALGFAFAYWLLSPLPRLLAPLLPTWLPYEWLEATFVLGLGLPFLRAEGRPLADLGLRLDRRWARDLGLGTLVGTGLILLMAGILALTGDYRFQWDPSASLGRFTMGTWLYLAVAANEELIFRGYAFQRLATGTRPWLAQLVLATLFAAVHLNNPGITGETRAWAMLDIGLAGLLLGQAFLRTGSLALPMGLHLGWNWTQGTLLGIPVSGTPPEGLLATVVRPGPVWRTGGPFGLEATLVCALVAGAAFLLLVLLPRRPSEETP